MALSQFSSVSNTLPFWCLWAFCLSLKILSGCCFLLLNPTQKMVTLGTQCNFSLSSHWVQVPSRLYYQPLQQSSHPAHSSSDFSCLNMQLLLFLSALYYLLRQHPGSSLSACPAVPLGREAIAKWEVYLGVCKGGAYTVSCLFLYANLQLVLDLLLPGSLPQFSYLVCLF